MNSTFAHLYPKVIANQFCWKTAATTSADKVALQVWFALFTTWLFVRIWPSFNKK